MYRRKTYWCQRTRKHVVYFYISRYWNYANNYLICTPSIEVTCHLHMIISATDGCVYIIKVSFPLEMAKFQFNDVFGLTRYSSSRYTI